MKTLWNWYKKLNTVEKILYPSYLVFIFILGCIFGK
jgi:hypothetical protein